MRLSIITPGNFYPVWSTRIAKSSVLVANVEQRYPKCSFGEKNTGMRQAELSNHLSLVITSQCCQFANSFYIKNA